MRMTTDGTVTTLPGFPRLSGPRYMALARDGTLWVGLEQSRQIVRVTGIVAPPTGGGGTGGGGGGGTTVGTQTRRGVSGANRLSIAGKIGRRTIPADFYRLTIVATDAAGNASKPVTQVLEVTPREKRSSRRGATL